MKLLFHLKRAAIVACLPAFSLLLPIAAAAPPARPAYHHRTTAAI